jgi:hypothetical protein
MNGVWIERHNDKEKRKQKGHVSSWKIVNL